MVRAGSNGSAIKTVEKVRVFTAQTASKMYVQCTWDRSALNTMKLIRITILCIIDPHSAAAAAATTTAATAAAATLFVNASSVCYRPSWY